MKTRMHRPIQILIKVMLFIHFMTLREINVYGEFVSNHFNFTSCPDTTEMTFLMAGVGDNITPELQALSLLGCAVTCNQDVDCNYAIFQRDIKTCRHLNQANFSFSSRPPPPPPQARETNCTFIMKTNPKFRPQCQNGGTPLDYICQCPNNYTGVTCEEPNREFCYGTSWRKVISSEMNILAKSNLKAKLKIIKSDIKLFPVSLVNSFGDSIYNLQSNNYLAMNTDASSNDASAKTFLTPILRRFKFYSNVDRQIETHYAGLDGHVFLKVAKDTTIKVIMRDAVDDDLLVYQDGVKGSVGQLLDGLSNGYRLLTREFTRVGFDTENSDAFFQGVRTNLGAEKKDMIPNLYFESYKKTLKTSQRFETRWRLASGAHISSDSPTEDVHPWELDRCWVKINSPGTDEEFNNVLKEIILEGRDVRIIMEGSISTDVSSVTITINDVIVSLADYLTPFDAHSSFNESTRVIFSLLSTSRVLSECKKDFLGSTVYEHGSREYTGTMEWFFSSRPFSKTLTVNSNGQAIFGSAKEVVSAVNQGLDVRVCLEVTADALWTCSGSFTQSVYSDGDHVMVETSSVMKVGLHQDGTLKGIEGEACKESVMLLLTEGSVQMVVYSLGTPSEDDDVTNVDFSTMTWYVES